jgi:hypothetical protein
MLHRGVIFHSNKDQTVGLLATPGANAQSGVQNYKETAHIGNPLPLHIQVMR